MTVINEEQPRPRNSGDERVHTQLPRPLGSANSGACPALAPSVSPSVMGPHMPAVVTGPIIPSAFPSAITPSIPRASFCHVPDDPVVLTPFVLDLCSRPQNIHVWDIFISPVPVNAQHSAEIFLE